MSSGVIIFSRMGSKRLPGKALIDISGRSLLGRVIDKSRQINGVDRIIVATSTNIEDNEIASFASNEGVDIYRGDSDNVAARALDTCDFYGLKNFARICGDRPFFDADLISSIINIHNNSEVDVVTTLFPRTYPPGLTGEVISTEALRRAVSKMNTSEDKEHITSFFYKNPFDFSIKNIDTPKDLDFSDINLCVDNDQDLLQAKWIASKIDNLKTSNVALDTLVLLAKEWLKLSKN